MGAKFLLVARSLGIRIAGDQVFGALVGILAVAILIATFRAGIDRGMDQLIGWQASARVANAIAGAMTEQRFHAGGYAVSGCIFGELIKRGFTGNADIAKKLGMTIPETLKSGIFLDQVLNAVWRDLPKLPDRCGSGSSIRGIGDDDLGYIDFAKLAFSAFGLHIRALYYLFFAIYGLTLLVAVLERRNNPEGQVILLTVAALIYASCYYANYLDPAKNEVAGNMLDPRFIAVLGLIPTVHLLLMTVDRVRPDWWRSAIVIFQAGVIFFVIHIRATGVWCAMAIVLALLTLSLLSAKMLKQQSDGWVSITARSVAGYWPALIALVVIFAGMKVVSMSLHPIYREEGWSSHHPMWFAVYYSLQFNPRWYAEGYFASHGGADGDQMPIAAARAYLKEHPDEDRPEIYLPDSKTLKLVARERLCRLAFLQFFRRDPWFVLETFFIVKGGFFSHYLFNETRLEWKNAGTKRQLAVVLALVMIGLMAARRPAGLQKLSLFTTVFAIGAAASLAIPLVTLAYQNTVSEEIMAVQITGLLLVSLLFGYLTHWLIRSHPKFGCRSGSGWK